MIKLIAIDMDGTLLGDEREVTKENAKAVKEAQMKGVTVVVATGRDEKEARTPLREAGISCPIISVNGAETRGESGEILSIFPLSKEKTKSIFDILVSEKVYFEVYTNKGAFTNHYELGLQTVIDVLISSGSNDSLEKMRSIAEERYKTGAIQIVDSYETLLNSDDVTITKVLAFSQNDRNRENAKRKLKEHEDLAISSSASDNIEITDIRAQKGIAIEAWATKHGISMNEVMVIGDSLNDVSMFEVAKYRIAMGNAEEKIKKLSSFITKTNDEDGVAYAIRTMLAEING